MNTEKDIENFIKVELTAIRNGHIRTWGQIGRLLDIVEASGYWQISSSSFTDWLKGLGGLLKLKEGSLWRFLTVARRYEQLLNNLIKLGVTVPPLAELPDKVSPESLEIFFKLERAVPTEIMINLAKQVVTATISRADLRSYWQAYRPVLKGQTARGKGVSAPRIDPRDIKYRHPLLEAKALTTLLSNNNDWLGIPNPNVYSTFLDVTATSAADSPESVMFDAVVAVQASKSATLDYHGIAIKYGMFGDVYDNNMQVINSYLNKRQEFCDYFWVVTYEAYLEDAIEVLDNSVGLITISDVSFKVIRPAKQCKTPKYSGELAKVLLKQALKR